MIGDELGKLVWTAFVGRGESETHDNAHAKTCQREKD
jgi:hypothetical protein